jgi:hypothetical protein
LQQVSLCLEKRNLMTLHHWIESESKDPFSVVKIVSRMDVSTKLLGLFHSQGSNDDHNIIKCRGKSILDLTDLKSISLTCGPRKPTRQFMLFSPRNRASVIKKKCEKAVVSLLMRMTGDFYNPFPRFAFTGPLRPSYPLSARRQVPDHIPRPEYADNDGKQFSITGAAVISDETYAFKENL